MLDAMSFALFGRPHRNINKPQLVNTINNKECIVEIEFTIGKATLELCVGSSRTLFEIWKDDSMLNQSSHCQRVPEDPRTKYRQIEP